MWVYQYAHLPLIIGTMVWAFTQRREQWTFYRNWFLAMNFVAVLVFALLPTAPPRMIFTSGVADMNFLHGIRSAILENGMLGNPFAAMPSLHFGYALFIGLTLYTLTRVRWVRYLGFVYAFVVFVTIVATGNHFIVDAIAGGLVVLAAWAFAVNIQPAAAPSPVTVRERDG